VGFIWFEEWDLYGLWFMVWGVGFIWFGEWDLYDLGFRIWKVGFILLGDGGLVELLAVLALLLLPSVPR